MSFDLTAAAERIRQTIENGKRADSSWISRVYDWPFGKGEPKPDYQQDQREIIAAFLAQSPAYAELREEVERLRGLLLEIRLKLAEVVCTKEPDRGVVMLSQEGTSHWDAERGGQVYDHEHFSALGDALIELYELAHSGAPEVE